MTLVLQGWSQIGARKMNTQLNNAPWRDKQASTVTTPCHNVWWPITNICQHFVSFHINGAITSQIWNWNTGIYKHTVSHTTLLLWEECILEFGLCSLFGLHCCTTMKHRGLYCGAQWHCGRLLVKYKRYCGVIVMPIWLLLRN